MDYQLIVDGTQISSGSIYFLGSIIILITVIFITIIYFLIEKIRKESLLKYEFITIIAHKFRTPLTSVKWIIEEMMREEIDSYKKQNMGDIFVSNQKLIDLTGTLLELIDSSDPSKTSYVFEKIPLCPLVQNVANSLKETFHKKNIFISVQCQADDVFIYADKPRTEFVMQTLLENACIYTPIGRNVEVYVYIKGNKAIVSVKDNGIGIDNSDIPKIFSKFYRTTNAKQADTEGFGVGLYLARTIIRHQKGDISVYSEGLNRGSTFSVILPKK